MIQRFLFTAAARSNVFAYNLVCILKASSSPTNISLSMLSHIDWLENTTLADHCMKCVAQNVMMLVFRPYIVSCCCAAAEMLALLCLALWHCIGCWNCMSVLQSEGTPGEDEMNPTVKRSGWRPPEDTGLWGIADRVLLQVSCSSHHCLTQQRVICKHCGCKRYWQPALRFLLFLLCIVVCTLHSTLLLCNIAGLATTRGVKM